MFFDARTGLAARVGADVGPRLDHGDAMAVKLRHLQQRSQVLAVLDHLFERRRQAPVEQALAGQPVAPGKGRGRIAVAQEVAEQGVHRLRTRRVLAEDAGLVAPAEQVGGRSGHRQRTKQDACHRLAFGLAGSKSAGSVSARRRPAPRPHQIRAPARRAPVDRGAAPGDSTREVPTQ